MAKKKQEYDVDFSKIAKKIIDTPVEDFVEESYLPFTHYVITSRALISDDGLKPVQRRTLYGMLEMGINDKGSHIKAGRIAGEVMGKYHPHADSSISDSLARMAQPFTMRVPLIDPFGSVGHTTGDAPAAPRYWEARLTKQAMEVLSDLKEGAVEMGMNYDGNFKEPALLPIKWPVGLINGTQGIAVGYASNMVPHNPTEVMNGCIALIKNPDITVEKLSKIIKGPDMPTGGTLVGYDGVESYFKTGKGTFSVRGKYVIEPGARGTHTIIFSEAPFQVSGEDISLKIAARQKDNNQFKEISSYKELSDKKNGFRYSIKLKGGVNPEAVLRDLFKYTPLEQSFSVNNTILVDGVPKVVNIKEIIEIFINFRYKCVTNKAQNKLNKLDKVIERLNGIIKVLVDIDKTIKIIRNSEDSTTASEELQKAFKVNEEQADYILSLPLRKLTKSDSIAIQTEIEKHKEDKERMQTILSNPEEMKNYIIDELEQTKKVVTDDRRTVILNKTHDDLKKEESEIKKSVSNAAKNLDCYITMYNNGEVIRTDAPVAETGNKVGIIAHAKSKTQEDIVFIMKDGSAMKIPSSFVLEQKVKASVTTGVDSSKIVGIGFETAADDNLGTLVVTSNGGLNIVNGTSPNSKEFIFTKLSKDEEIIATFPISEKDYKEKNIVLVSSDGFVLKFPLEQIRTSRAGAGTVKGMNLNTGVKIAGASISEPGAGIVVSCSYETIKVVDLEAIPDRNRGAKGVILHKLKDDDEILSAYAGKDVIANKANKKIKLPEISTRATVGTARSGSDILLGHVTIQ